MDLSLCWVGELESVLFCFVFFCLGDDILFCHRGSVCRFVLKERGIRRSSKDTGEQNAILGICRENLVSFILVKI
jgi:hypothetical protein